jgi:hypothetical protein
MSRAYIEICVLPFSLRLLAMNQFELATDDELRQTAAWAADLMKAMDWVARHEIWDRFLGSKPKRFCVMVAAHFGPDQLLEGSAEGFEPPVVIVLNCKLKRQTKIEDFFAKRPRTE